MQIYQGIQIIYTHAVQLFRGISNWFSQIDWTVLVEQYPVQFQGTIAAVLVLLVSLAGIGVIKKLSFLLG